MKELKNRVVSIAFVMCLSMISVFAQGYGVNNRQLSNLINQIDTKTNNFKSQLNRSNSSVYNPRNRNNIFEAVSAFEYSKNQLKQNFNSRRDISSNISDLMTKAESVENAMRGYRLTPQVENSWRVLRADLNTLSNNYSSNPGWNNSYTNSLTGTYRLNISQSENVTTAINRSISNANNNQRERMRTNLERRLAVPNDLAIQRNNYTITMASSNAGQTTFEANGRPQTETLSNGRRMTNTVSLSGDKLTINSDGDQVNAFYIVFEPYNNGQKLRVTRRLYLENRNQTITVVSVYDKTSNVANWNIQQNNGYPNYGNVGYPNNGDNRFYIQNGTQLTAVLNNSLSTRQNNEGERFSMTVTAPSTYYGAIIEGTIDKVSRSGRVSGQAELSLNFDTIKFRNGGTYRFEGFIDKVTTTNGRTINIDNENSIQSGSQTTDTVVRSGVGAAIGAIIGGIAGGGKGAAIGAAIGAGAGGGSVLVQGRDDIELTNGTTFNITASSNVR